MVYLDYNSTTPVDERVLAAMTPYFQECFGNASCKDYKLGWDASDAVHYARQQVADLINAEPKDLYFVSGASQGCSALIGFIAGCLSQAGKSFLLSTAEHQAVLSACQFAKAIYALDFFQLDTKQFACSHLSNAERTAAVGLICMMLANNETGTVNDLSKIMEKIGAEKLLFSDLTQAVGKLRIDVQKLGIDFSVFSSHKMCGPKGVGVIYARAESLGFVRSQRELRSQPVLNFEAGTLNVPGIVGLGEACRIAKKEMESDNARIVNLRDRLEATLLTELPEIWINGAGAPRLCNTSNIGFRGVDARTMIRDMHDIACSTKSACSSGDAGPSHVLKAIGLTDEEAYSCIRFSLGRFTTAQEIDYAIEKIIHSVRKLRRSGGRGG